MAFLSACSESPEALLKDGHAAMVSLDDSVIDPGDSALIAKGIASLETFCDRYPKNSHADSALFMLGSLEGATGKNELATQSFLKLVEEYPQSKFRPKSIILAGHTYEAMRDYERARACYERLIREYPDHEFVRGGSAQWLLDHLGQPPEEWLIPFGADSAAARSDTLKTARRPG